eukprot:Gregarina_sp_Poly_1__9319@NODE_5790_length_329_cov_5416_175573_g4281_i0_p1_GENE_NODE_5790_length_329_cov_5416_175573_g4281_i0NODE_5790_length_329_cov_5416_175573_g4281_i0_p1_ORF_typecomplete_len102_score14_80ADH_zinc_N/PF00107_26/0_00029ADH_zinc_N/PF00107_26/2_3e02ADH_zinc_N_2/PF13602_6/0_065BKACE/PF05853_12/0_19_NODE_5790_length_329_cov_5416_175573_g4281_i02307
MDDYLGLLKVEGTLITVGAPPFSDPIQISAFRLIVGNRGIRGSNVGGIAENQEMLDFAAQHNILPWVECINGKDINEAYQRIIDGDVLFRFVMDVRATHGN